MAEVCTHNKYDDNPTLRADYDAAIEYRRAGKRTMFPLAVAAVVAELTGEVTQERVVAVHHGIICATGACAVNVSEVSLTVVG